MNQEQMFAQAYILQTIGELDEETSAKLFSKIPRGMYESVDEALKDFESSSSVTIALVDWVKETWKESTLTPKAFAKEICDDFLASLE